MNSQSDIKGNDLLNGVIPLILKGRYGRDLFLNDLGAGIIVTLMLIPQSLAYALIAGLPAEMGLYASILPLVAYALFGTSAALAVGPVAIVSMLVASTLTPMATPGSAEYVQLAMLLALLSGGFYFLMGLFKLGFVTQLLSYPVLKGFITSSSLLIIVGQVSALTGIAMERGSLIDRLASVDFTTLHNLSFIMGGVAVIVLYWVRSASGDYVFSKLFGGFASMMKRLTPMLLIIVSAILVFAFNLDDKGVKTVGELPLGLPSLGLPTLEMSSISALLLPAFLITLIGMTESIAVGQTLGASKRQRIDADKELLGLGASNAVAAVSGGFPVTGGMARSVVNQDAGAKTPIAGVLTAIFLTLGLLFFTPLLAYIPIPVLAATIIVAVSQLLEFKAMAQLYKKKRFDGFLAWLTAILVLVWHVEAGLIAGVIGSILWLLMIHRKPFIAEVGRLPGSERFKNVLHAETETLDHSLFLRIDESITFLNSGVIEQKVLKIIAEKERVEHFVILASGIHNIDSTGIAMLRRLCEELQSAGISLHMADMKVPLAKSINKFGMFDDCPEFFRQSSAELFDELKKGKPA